MIRYFFKSRDLEALSRFKAELENRGIAQDRIHAVSLAADSERTTLHLHTVADLMQRDLFRGGIIGLTAGVVLALAFLGLAAALGWQNTPAGWPILALVAVLIFGLCTWQGGYFGIRKLNHRFARWERELNAGHHLLFVELDDEQPELQRSDESTGAVEYAGMDKGRPRWTLIGQRRLRFLLTEQLP